MFGGIFSWATAHNCAQSSTHRFSLRHSIARLWRAVAAAALLFACVAPAMAQNIHMEGNIAAAVASLRPIGAAEPSSMLNLSIQFLPRDQAGLDALLAAQQDPASAQYHRWLTPEQYTDHFGPEENNFNSVTEWLTKNGFVVSGGSRQEGQIRFSGNVAQAETAFDVQIMKFGDGTQFSNTREPKIPARFVDVIGEIVGLNNLARFEPELRMKPARFAAPALARPQAIHSKLTSGLSPAISLGPLGGLDTTFAPPDLYTFYDETPLLNAGTNGAVANDCIGIFSLSNVYPDLLNDFTNPPLLDYTLPAVNLSVDLVNGADPGVNSAEGEAYLDIEWSHAVAPGAPIVLYVPDESSQTGEHRYSQELRDAIGAAVTENRCGAINISYSSCGVTPAFIKNTLGTIFSQAASQGQSVFISSGDKGADSCNENRRDVNEMSASPNVMSVGGTEFAPNYDSNGNNVGFVAESAWNQNEQSNAGENETTGGGVSRIFRKPSWQRIRGVPKSNGREVPDIAMIAGSPSVLVVTAAEVGGTPTDIPLWHKDGGTSLSSPIWAGISRLIQQKTGTRLGSLNPTIYQLASEDYLGSGFRDVFKGNNTFVNSHDRTIKGYSAGPGYDLTTGWGTVDIGLFVNAYAAAVKASTP